MSHSATSDLSLLYFMTSFSLGKKKWQKNYAHLFNGYSPELSIHNKFVHNRWHYQIYQVYVRVCGVCGGGIDGMEGV